MEYSDQQTAQAKGTKHAKAYDSTIHVDSYMRVGSDHDAVSQLVYFRQRGGRASHKVATRPRTVKAGEIQPLEVMSQQDLEGLAAKYTKPWASQAYEDPPDVKVLYQMARAGMQSEDWKKAHRGRAAARRRWREDHVAAACRGNWGSYRVGVKKGATGWEDEFANAMPEDKNPHEEIHNHLQSIYQGTPLKALEGEVESVPDFTVEELRAALTKGQRRKSVGRDKVSHELLVEIGNRDDGAKLLVEWINRILHGGRTTP